jgi:hypothetical protein
MACRAYALAGALGVVRAGLPSYPEMVERMFPVAAEVVALRRAAKHAPKKRKRKRLLLSAERLLARAAEDFVAEVTLGLISGARARVPSYEPFRVDEWPLDPAGRAA